MENLWKVNLVLLDKIMQAGPLWKQKKSLDTAFGFLNSTAKKGVMFECVKLTCEVKVYGWVVNITTLQINKWKIIYE